MELAIEMYQFDDGIEKIYSRGTKVIQEKVASFRIH
jgi:hypothetical protein